MKFGWTHALLLGTACALAFGIANANPVVGEDAALTDYVRSKAPSASIAAGPAHSDLSAATSDPACPGEPLGGCAPHSSFSAVDLVLKEALDPVLPSDATARPAQPPSVKVDTSLFVYGAAEEATEDASDEAPAASTPSLPLPTATGSGEGYKNIALLQVADSGSPQPLSGAIPRVARSSGQTDLMQDSGRAQASEHKGYGLSEVALPIVAAVVLFAVSFISIALSLRRRRL